MCLKHERCNWFGRKHFMVKVLDQVPHYRYRDRRNICAELYDPDIWVIVWIFNVL